jgi:acyl-CoA reductase-like NAD-dependent aldehyde dehydrogenase
MTKKRDAIDVVNPYDGTTVGSVSRSTVSEVEGAIGRASQAFQKGPCLAMDRYTILREVSELLKEQGEEFARLVCRETGKPIRESRVEVERACTTLLWSAQESLRVEGVVQPCDVTPQRLPRTAYVHRVPLGVVVAITPFNFPLNIPAHKVGPALAGGNAVIVKPSPKAPLATTRLVGLFHQAGLNNDMLQVLNGDADVVEALARGNAQAVSFTGSSRVGPRIAEWAAGKKVVMELGGNGAIVAMDDADPVAVSKAIISHRFGSSGQRCTSCKRAFLHEDIYGEVRGHLLEGVSELVVGDPMDDSTDIGPLIDEEAAIRVMDKLDAARARGARAICGGSRQGAFVLPTLVEGVTPQDILFQEETFGPVLPIISFSDFGEAVNLVNSTPYGLQAGIFTNRMDTIMEAFREFEVGTVVVNEGPGLRVEPIPFGGVKSSGIGQEGIRYAVEEFTHLKTLVLRSRSSQPRPA